MKSHLFFTSTSEKPDMKELANLTIVINNMDKPEIKCSLDFKCIMRTVKNFIPRETRFHTAREILFASIASESTLWVHAFCIFQCLVLKQACTFDSLQQKVLVWKSILNRS